MLTWTRNRTQQHYKSDNYRVNPIDLAVRVLRRVTAISAREHRGSPGDHGAATSSSTPRARYNQAQLLIPVFLTSMANSAPHRDSECGRTCAALVRTLASAINSRAGPRLHAPTALSRIARQEMVASRGGPRWIRRWTAMEQTGLHQDA